MTVVPLRHARPLGALALAGAMATVIAGCSGSTTPSAVASAVANASFPAATEAPSEPPSEAMSAEPSSAATEAPSETELPSAVATAIDPCQLITAAEAGQMVGVTFGAGKEHEGANHVKSCTYTSGTNTFTVDVAVAPDEATAKTAENQAVSAIESNQGLKDAGMKETKLTNFAPGTDALILDGQVKGQISLAARALMLLKGVTYVGFSDLAIGGDVPSQDAFKNEAMTVISRIP
jgi:hypothetical protein